MNPPTAADPWTVTIGWTPDQNFGRPCVMPSRAPLFAILGLMAAGEQPDVIAAEHDLTAEAVHVLWQLIVDIQS